jgi:hypothetical protein
MIPPGVCDAPEVAFAVALASRTDETARQFDSLMVTSWRANRPPPSAIPWALFAVSSPAQSEVNMKPNRMILALSAMAVLAMACGVEGDAGLEDESGEQEVAEGELSAAALSCTLSPFIWVDENSGDVKMNAIVSCNQTVPNLSVSYTGLKGIHVLPGRTAFCKNTDFCFASTRAHHNTPGAQKYCINAEAWTTRLLSQKGKCLPFPI